MEEDTLLSLENSCRVCLSQSSSSQSLYSCPEGRQISPADLLQQFASLSVNSQDKGPQLICSLCISQLYQCSDLIEKCLETQIRISRIQDMKREEEVYDSHFDTVEENRQEEIIIENFIKPKKKRGRKPKASKISNSSEIADDVEVKARKSHTTTKNNRDHTCEQCGKRFKYKDNLKAHVMTHTGERPFKCEMCNKSFIKKDNLAIHVKRHLKQRNFSCEQCGSAYYTSYELKTHMRVHTGEKPHVCTLCGKRFTAKNNLYIHQRSHTGEKPHVCTVCGKQFTSKNILLIHSRIHTGEKPYICSVCGKRFTANKLAVHMRTHTGEKPHVCTLCGKQFAATNVLVIHMRRHTGEKPYECKICGQTYGHTQSLNKHMRKQHKIITNPLQIQMQKINETHRAQLEISEPPEKDQIQIEKNTIIKYHNTITIHPESYPSSGSIHYVQKQEL